jgi:hypothetical protein
MSYLRYLYLFGYCGVQHILCCVFVLFVFVLCVLCCQFLWIVHFVLPLRYSLTFIHTYSDCLRGIYVNYEHLSPRCVNVHNIICVVAEIGEVVQ